MTKKPSQKIIQRNDKNQLMVPLWLAIVSIVVILALAFCIDAYVDFHNDRVRMDKLFEKLDK